MGCFMGLKSKKKKFEHIISVTRTCNKVQEPSVLPEPNVQKSRSLQSAPPSFKTRVKRVQSDFKAQKTRTRALSAPETFDAAEEVTLVSNDIDEQDMPKGRASIGKELRSTTPLPLPLPLPEDVAALRPTGSFKSVCSSGPLNMSGPLPLPPNGSAGLLPKNFSFDEIQSACHNFSSDRCVFEGLSSVIYRASFPDDTSSSKKLEASVTCLNTYIQSQKEFANEIHVIASLRHPNLCRLIGYHARETSENRMLVYERLYYGNLDRILFGRSEGPSLDWSTRTKVALCAAQGLMFLHEEGPFQAMYNELSTANIQIDKDFSAKLSGYGCVGNVPEGELSNGSTALGSLSIETLEKGLLTPKSNVWSFGVILLELLTGRKNLDPCHPKEERNLVRWSRPFLSDEWRLSLIMDPQLKGRFSARAAGIVADVALRCLQTEPSDRPTMRTVVDHLKGIQDIKFSCRYPLQEPTVAAAKHMYRSPSFGAIASAPKLNTTRSPPPRAPPSVVSPTLFPLSLPPRTCSTTSLEELERREIKKNLSSDICCPKG